MGVLGKINDIIASLPENSAMKQRIEHLKEQYEGEERKHKETQEALRKARAEIQGLKEELAALQERYASAVLADDIEMRRPFAYHKGGDIRLCPVCFTSLSMRKTLFRCPKCHWEYEEVPTIPAGAVGPPRPAPRIPDWPETG